jgi:hypothetical protein
MPAEMVACPKCGVQNSVLKTHCYSCGAELAPTAAPGGPGSGPGMPPPIARNTNTSGQGLKAIVPSEARGWNWGAFLLTWIWCIPHKSWIGFVVLGLFVVQNVAVRLVPVPAAITDITKQIKSGSTTFSFGSDAPTFDPNDPNQLQSLIAESNKPSDPNEEYNKVMAETEKARAGLDKDIGEINSYLLETNLIRGVFWLIIIGMAIFMGVKGSEWAWRNRRFEGGIVQFQQVQNAWMIGGLTVAGALIVLSIIGFLIGVASFSMMFGSHSLGGPGSITYGP